uniref:Chaperone DnaJ C-terminal domain-containing protein n=1 Tax=Fagus sylvatica TaxID=28930 RepID=A0A2N9FRP7_FAGSY
MADLVLFQNLVASLLGGVEGKMVDLGGGGCCKELDVIPAMSLVATKIERFQKDVQRPFAPKFHEMLQNKNKGVDNDETIKVSRSGGADPDGNQPGDLYVVIKAILGGTIQVPTLTGDVVLKVRPGTQPAQKVVLKKKG